MDEEERGSEKERGMEREMGGGRWRDSWLWCERLAGLVVEGALLVGLVIAVEEPKVLLLTTQ